jgi:two-component system, OmpR family, heavy metal sensor histidine kinase CusS
MSCPNNPGRYTRELELLGRYQHDMAFVLAPALAASAVAGIVIARRGLRPVGEIAATARRIGPERLGERIAADGLPAELGDLARTFNVMLVKCAPGIGPVP